MGSGNQNCSCGNNNCAGCSGCITKLPATVWMGRSLGMIISLVDQCTGDPIDTSVYTDIEVDVPSLTAGSPIAVKLSLSSVIALAPSQGGKIQTAFTAAQTAMFAPTVQGTGVYTPITVKLTNASNVDQNPYIFVIPNALNIQPLPY